MPRVAQKVLERLKELAEEGLSTAQIANVMHVTRSTIAGWIDRHGAKFGIKLKRGHGVHGYGLAKIEHDPQKKLDRNRLKNLTLAQEEAAEELEEPPRATCDFWELSDNYDTRCHYPYGRRAPFMFCGAQSLPGLPYCKYHQRLCNPHT